MTGDLLALVSSFAATAVTFVLPAVTRVPGFGLALVSVSLALVRFPSVTAPEALAPAGAFPVTVFASLPLVLLF